jgi:signal transduction histidine kinase
VATPALALSAEPSAVRAPKATLLWALAACACAAAAGILALALTSEFLPDPGLEAGLRIWITVSYVFAGLVAWWRRPDSRLGILMVAAGFATALTTLSWSSASVPWTIGVALDFLPPVLFLHVFLAFPSGRLESYLEKVVVVAAYAAAVGVSLLRLVLGGFGPENVLGIFDEPLAAERIGRYQLFAMSAVALAGICLLALRRRRTGRSFRRSVALLIDSFALALAMIALLFVLAAYQNPHFETVRRLTLLAIGLAPVAFLFGLLDARLARSAVGDLFLDLRGDPSPADLRDALARALRDPSLTLAYWLPDFASYVDLDGRPVEVPDPGGRAVTAIDRNGVHVAALLHDHALEDEQELLDAVGAAAGIALENARLQAELAARLEEVKGSRARVLEAGQKERQRLERNLHDGAQQRLVALSLRLKALEKDLGREPGARAQFDEVQREITLSLAELRDLAKGIHPAVLSAHGLGVALEQVAARAPVRVRLAVDIDSRLPEPVEVAAYYVVTESLANVAKHARARNASVDIGRGDGVLVVEVVDDGVGGADSERGSGLRGLADRVEALGGRLRVWTPRGGGTRVRADIPCA